jgi:hypothetical protein
LIDDISQKRTSQPPVSITALFRLYISGPRYSLDLAPGAAKTW